MSVETATSSRKTHTSENSDSYTGGIVGYIETTEMRGTCVSSIT